MRYISTRGQAPILDFEGVLLAGLATDGGLYVPQEWPQFSTAEIASFIRMDYEELAYTIMAPFVGDSIAEKALRTMIHEAYASFRHKAVAPLVQIDSRQWVMELFHGPTLAFKDFALQLLGQLLDYVLQRRGEQITIVGATSGDTGSAAIAGCRDRDNMRIFILHPKGRVSDVQRRQMTTVDAANVHNIAVEGTFDDCQAMVKALFNDAAFRQEQKLAAVNSINWARIMAQIVYYFYAAVQLGAPARALSFSVPTGNFGDVYAGYVAKQMGLPIDRLMVATGRNDILARFFQQGDYSAADVVPTIAPSIDIQVSSNFERLLFDLYGRDGARIKRMMENFHTSGKLTVGSSVLLDANQDFDGLAVSEETIRSTIKQVYAETGMVLDPHSAVGVHAAREQAKAEQGRVWVSLATAHPAKFPDAVKQACGQHPALPDEVKHIVEGKERYDVLPHDLATLQQYIRDK